MSSGPERSLAPGHNIVPLKTSPYPMRYQMEDTDENRLRKSRTTRKSSAPLPGQPHDAKKSVSTNLETQQTQAETCAACVKPITDRYILRALDQSWHSTCLVCSVCSRVLGELGPSLFVRGDLVLCRHDYIRLFGSSGQCSGCLRAIASHECVMRARDFIFHPECFNCFRCGRRLCTGDRFYLEEHRPTCAVHVIDSTVFITSRSDLQSLVNEKVTENTYDKQTDQSGCQFPMATSIINAPKEDSFPETTRSTYHLYEATLNGTSVMSQTEGLSSRLPGPFSDSSFCPLIPAAHCEGTARINRQTQVH